MECSLWIDSFPLEHSIFFFFHKLQNSQRSLEMAHTLKERSRVSWIRVWDKEDVNEDKGWRL